MTATTTNPTAEINLSKLRYASESRDDGYRSSYYVEYHNGGLSIQERRSDINGQSMASWNGHTLSFDLADDGVVDADALDALLESDEVVALVARITDGYSSDWNGSNHIGSFDADAVGEDDGYRSEYGGAAGELAAIIRMCEQLPEGAGIWSAGDWLCHADFCYSVRIRSTDAELEVIAEKLVREAAENMASIDERSTLSYLKSEQDQLLETGEDELADLEAHEHFALAILDTHIIKLHMAVLEASTPKALERALSALEDGLNTFGA
jgi:hypothetical protein